MVMQLIQSHPQRVQIVEVLGRIDNHTIGELVALLEQAIAEGQNELVLDMSGVKYMNSAGLRELVRVYEQASRSGGMVHIANPSPQIQTLLELVGLDTVFKIHVDQLWSMARLTHHGLPVRRRQVCIFA
jgi:anti-anti-sigma factor